MRNSRHTHIRADEEDDEEEGLQAGQGFGCHHLDMNLVPLIDRAVELQKMYSVDEQLDSCEVDECAT